MSARHKYLWAASVVWGVKPSENSHNNLICLYHIIIKSAKKRHNRRRIIKQMSKSMKIFVCAHIFMWVSYWRVRVARQLNQLQKWKLRELSVENGNIWGFMNGECLLWILRRLIDGISWVCLRIIYFFPRRLKIIPTFLSSYRI